MIIRPKRRSLSTSWKRMSSQLIMMMTKRLPIIIGKWLRSILRRRKLESWRTLIKPLQKMLLSKQNLVHQWKKSNITWKLLRVLPKESKTWNSKFKVTNNNSRKFQMNKILITFYLSRRTPLQILTQMSATFHPFKIAALESVIAQTFSELSLPLKVNWT